VTFQVIDSAEVLAKRTVYFVRHGESSWNKAQSKLDLYEMGRQTDHPLSSKGREQAEELSSLVNEAQDNDLLHPDVIYVSPLTRAIQTAVIGLRSVLAQPDFGHVVLMANAREKQNFGGFDSKPCCTGSNVLKRTLDELVLLYKGQKGADEVVKAFQKLKIDTAEVEDRWWHNVQAESPAQLKGRLSEFMAQLKYSPYKSIVVVGHSHFFRAVFKEFVSDSFKERRKDFADQLSKMKLSNCGVARLSLDPSVEQGGPITDVELILGTHLDADGGLCKCQGPPPRLDENEVRTKDK
jgi:broad specificity phosphatase PhoE